jgi:hypothetical protein
MLSPTVWGFRAAGTKRSIAFRPALTRLAGTLRVSGMIDRGDPARLTRVAANGNQQSALSNAFVKIELE